MTSGSVATVSTKARILEVAAALVAESPNGDVSTRAVCEAAGVGAPALYRHFGDKEGLLSAVVDSGWEKYLATKRDRAPGTDPVQDLREGWDTHTEFALQNPNLYRLMNSPAMRTPPAAALESHQILTYDLQRAAEQGKLRLAPELAAQIIMSANVGVALMLVSRPATFTDRTVSRRVRDAVHAAVFTPDVTGSGPDLATADGDEVEVPATAARLGAMIRTSPSPAFTPAETGLLTEWLDRLSNTSRD
ncbi:MULTISPECIES: TetR/AcrR family transcriptional regulator [unclassified Streptomyces]|uniref:TetR/AcrR family transcriptional regulator n=1 Tax=unclassified Streptomyces TaxID=2593676 RepID=UPI002E80D986|nr:TetR/AcrR family transcriptional regulator [Streptomyces sp. NBC_00589]WTI38437.1 TetR/AcrR family transcriptional regulator [Streptomyces sp. NBC_00775]WUB27885.1 TetR/AcrR family transcriptional regulator [Streptomyces sp. NBC_00589]